MMKNRILALLILAALVLAMFAGCEEKPSVLTAEEAQAIAIEYAGLDEKDVSDVHTHVGEYEGKPCYSIHLTVNGASQEFVIDAATGDVLYSGEGGH